MLCILPYSGFPHKLAGETADVAGLRDCATVKATRSVSKIELPATESPESYSKCATSQPVITRSTIPQEAWLVAPRAELGLVAGMNVVDKFPDITMAGLAAASYQDGLPLLTSGRVEHNLSQVLFPRYLYFSC